LILVIFLAPWTSVWGAFCFAGSPADTQQTTIIFVQTSHQRQGDACARFTSNLGQKQKVTSWRAKKPLAIAGKIDKNQRLAYYLSALSCI